MRPFVLGYLVAAVWFSAAASADDHVVLIDEDVDFSQLRTFTVRDVRITSKHPALNSPVVRDLLRDATKTALSDKGLSESRDRAALLVECSVRGVDFAIDRMGRPVEEGSTGRGGRRRQPNPNQRDFTEGTLVIDLIRGDTGALVWRGVYHDTDPAPSKIAAAMPKHAVRLLSQFPRLKKP